MKGKILLVVLFALLSAGLFAQGKPVVAVAPFDVIGNAVTAEQASEINDVFYVRLGNTRSVELVNRNIVSQVLKEHKFQADDWSNDKKTAEFAKALNANWIVQGNIRKSGNNLLIIIQFYDIKTFKFEGGTDIRLANADEAYEKMNPLVDSLIKTIADTGTRAPAPEATISNKTYKVGDFGPAGGIIFYDKGVFSGGWRYLEAAPAETEFTAQWGADQHDVVGTGTAIGSGKRNTQLIIDHLKSKGENGRAAQLCDSLDFDGYKDWFLPSKDELDLMYKNLAQKGLGNFITKKDTTNWTNIYGSSSQSSKYNVWSQYFDNGIQSSLFKYAARSVRAIRAF